MLTSWLDTSIEGCDETVESFDREKLLRSIRLPCVKRPVTEAEIEERIEAREDPEPAYTSGVLAKYGRDFGSAANGAVTNPGVQWD